MRSLPIAELGWRNRGLEDRTSQNRSPMGCSKAGTREATGSSLRNGTSGHASLPASCSQLRSGNASRMELFGTTDGEPFVGNPESLLDSDDLSRRTPARSPRLRLVIPGKVQRSCVSHDNTMAVGRNPRKAGKRSERNVEPECRRVVLARPRDVKIENSYGGGSSEVGARACH